MWGLIGSIIGEAADDGMQFASKGYDQYLWKKNLSHYAEKQYEYAQRYSENSPSWSVKGLRDAGLNPVLAVSNGVNLGANVPNFSSSSPSGMVKSDFGGKITASLSRKIDQQNAESNSQNAESNKIQAQAAMIQAEAALKRALSDSRKTDAEIALRSVETEKLQGSKFDSSIMRDAEKLIKHLIDIPSQLKHTDPYTPYIQNKPLIPSETNTQYLKRLKDSKSVKSGDHTRLLYKSRRKFPDGSDVHRKFGDVGGMLPTVR